MAVSTVAAKAKTEPAKQMDALQAALRPALRGWGFRGRGRTFNRATADGLTQVISFQMGAYDPSGVHIPGLRENLYGRFTINLGVFVPEVYRYQQRVREEQSFVQEYSCCMRSRIGALGPEQADLWWSLNFGATRAGDIQQRLERDALPFLDRYQSRDAILDALASKAEDPATGTPRIVCAIILAGRQRQEEARRLLAAQAREAHRPAHAEYVRGLAATLGLGGLDA